MNTATKFTVLIIEDETNITDIICKCLKSHHYKPLQASSGTEGLSVINSQCPDIVLLDLGLPDMDGLSIIREVRNWSSVPIIVVSARTQEKEKVDALDAGADDYITKPFGTSELLARIRASLRHSNRLRNHSEFYKRPYQADALMIDFDKRIVKFHGVPIHLTPVEYRIVSLLAQNSGKVITYGALMTHIWGPYSDKNNNKILRVNMANIRRKLEENPAEPKYIFTEVGIGYRMREDEYNAGGS